MKPAGKSTVHHIRFPNDLANWLRKMAIANGRTLRGEIVFRLEKSKEFVKNA